MKRRVIPFRELLEQVLPVAKLPPGDRFRVSQALEQGDARLLETVGLAALERLVHLGHLRLIAEVRQGDDKVRRYRDLTTGNTIAVRHPVIQEDEGVVKFPLPIRDWRGSTSLDQIRTLLNLYDKLLTREAPVLRGPTDVLRQILLTARQVLSCERVSFWAPPRTGESPGPLAEIVTEVYDEPLARDWVLGERYLVLLHDLPARIDPASGTLDVAFQSLAMVPLGAPDLTVFGVLHAWSARSHHFSENRLGVLSLLSEVATDLVRRSEILKDLVFVDAGTRVYNRSYFNLQLENEIARTRREGSSLALAIADIDDFRGVNSRYGYEAGNQVLAAAAQVLKSGLRPFDSVARWGGEEFALILSSPVSEEDAAAVCERLRRTTELLRVAVTGLAGESASIQVTMSIGGAVYPGDGASSPALWRAANAALLQAKRTGKNRVIFASSMETGTGAIPPPGPPA